MKSDQLREDVPTYSGAIDPVDLGQDEQRRFEPLNGAKPKWPTHGLSLPFDMEPRRQRLQRKWQGPERVVVGRERPTQHTRDLPNTHSF